MHRLYMLFVVALLSHVIVTKITTIYNSFMNRFHMSLKEDFLGCLNDYNDILLPCAKISHVVEGYLSDLPYSHIAHNYI